MTSESDRRTEQCRRCGKELYDVYRSGEFDFRPLCRKCRNAERFNSDIGY